MPRMTKVVGCAVAAFGLGIMLSFFIPDTVMVVIEAVVIITLGVIFLK